MNFFSRYKRTLLIILFIATIIGVGYLLFLVFFKDLTPTGNIETPTSSIDTINKLPQSDTGSNINPVGQDNNLPQIGDNASSTPSTTSLIENHNPYISDKANGGLTNTEKLVDAITSGQTFNSQNDNVQYYNRSDGKFYSVNKDGQITALSNKVFHNVEQVTWDKGGDKAVLEYPDGSKIVYDFTNKKQVTLPSHWEDFNFSNNGSQLSMKSLGLDKDSRYLAIANSDGSGGKIIEYIGENEKSVYPSWSPNNQVVGMYTESLDYDRQTVYFLGSDNQNFKSMTIQGRGFQHQWSPKGDKMLYSVYSSDNEMKPGLWVVNSEGSQIGENRKRLNVNTWAEKCTFTGNDEIYCAVPTSLDYGAGFLPSLSNQIPDNIYKINIKTGSQQLIAIPENDTTIDSLFVSSDGSSLYFTDKNDSSINKINLH
ncbi:MAG TPA: hypothetical protein PKN62_02445 [bacterium]|nr:hypothetical protein [bacterium]